MGDDNESLSTYSLTVCYKWDCEATSSKNKKSEGTCEICGNYITTGSD